MFKTNDNEKEKALNDVWKKECVSGSLDPNMFVCITQFNRI